MGIKPIMVGNSSWEIKVGASEIEAVSFIWLS